MSLRAGLTTALVALLSFGLVAAIGLVLLSRSLHEATEQLGRSLESLRLVAELEGLFRRHTRASNLLLLGPSPELQNREQALESALQDTLSELWGSIEAPAEAALLRDVERELADYLASRARAVREYGSLEAVVRETNVEFEEALRPLRDLVELNVAQARTARARADRWDRMASVSGVTMAIALLGGIAGVLIWIVPFAFKPVFALQQAMRRYGRGERAARAPEQGPEELREIASSFNEMAEAIGRQRDNELAFIAAVAHDLRNPLHVLRGSVAMAEAAGTEARIRQTLSVVRRQVDGLERMVGDLLDRARIEAGQLDLQPAVYDLRDSVRHVLELYDQSTGHQIVTTIPPQPVPVEIDPLRLEQVVGNLLSNALKYSPEGSRVTVRLGITGDRATIEVADEGRGIAAEDQERIFEPFRRTEMSRGHFPGAGLGLSAARRIARAHGGDIEVHSAPGRGTTFRVWLPLAHAPAARAGLAS